MQRLKDYDEGTMVSSLEGRDTASWQPKSWVVGVVHNGVARAYDWNELVRERSLMDTLGGDVINLTLSKDLHSFSVVHITTEDHPFTPTNVEPADSATQFFQRTEKLDTLSAYQEFWHSWQTFHPNTTRYVPSPNE